MYELMMYFSYNVMSTKPLVLTWAFQHSDVPEGSPTTDIAKIHNIQVTNTLHGGATECQQCPMGVHNDGLVLWFIEYHQNSQHPGDQHSTRRGHRVPTVSHGGTQWWVSIVIYRIPPKSTTSRWPTLYTEALLNANSVPWGYIMMG